MTEDFIHYIWRTKNFNFRNLKTTDGAAVEILNFGQWNTHGGPDFLLARVSIDGTEWAGSVEMHLLSSDWSRHGHTRDPAYENVILHVVLEDDSPAYADDRKLPCIELREHIDGALLSGYLRLVANASWVPCASSLGRVPETTTAFWLERMSIERLEGKIAGLTVLLKELNENWASVFYYSLASAFGFKVNAAPFNRLARLLPLNTLHKHADSSGQMDALFFGCAGFLNQIFEDEYPLGLQNEFNHLSAKYNLKALDAHVWNWGRLRPANFPTIRLAQFSSLMSQFQNLLCALHDGGDMPGLRTVFDKPIDSYWNTHSAFDKAMRKSSRQIGSDSIDSIFINAIIPYVFFYGSRTNDARLTERALDLLTTLSPENNKITRGWTAIKMPNHHAGQSQALIHLKREYCDQRRCLSCAIGDHLLKTTAS